MVQTKIYPSCSHCQKEFRPGDFWAGANYCRGLYLFETLLRATTPKTTWELCQETGMPYADANRAMLKLRDFKMVEFTEEERPGGGRRFRYTPVVDKMVFAAFAAKLPLTPSLPEAQPHFHHLVP